MEPDVRLVHLAAAAADGDALDWNASSRVAPGPAPAEIHVLEAVSTAVRARTRTAVRAAGDTLSIGLRALCLLAGARALLGLGLEISRPDAGVLAALVAFGLTALVLLYAGDLDPRAIRLGVFYLLVAANLATRPITEAAKDAAEWVGVLASLQPEAFVGAAFVALLLRFPAAPDHLPAQVSLVKLSKASTALGQFLFLVTLAAACVPEGPLGDALIALSRAGSDGRGRIFWAAQFVVMALGARLALRKARLATGDEGRRVAAFVMAVLVGLGPLVLLSLGAILVPGVGRWVDRHEVATDAAVYAGLLSLPATTAAAVAAGRVLGLRLLARRALSYALARTTLHLLVLLPAMLLGFHLFGERDRPLAEALAAGWGRELLLVLGASILLSLFRRPMQRSLTRLFSRGEGDRGAGLQRLLGALGAARGRLDIAAALVTEVRQSLGTTDVRVFVRDARGPFVPIGSGCRPLDAGSALVALLEADSHPLEITPRLLGLLPDEDRTWASDFGLGLLVSLPGSTGEPAGLLALGDRASEEPWDRLAQELAQGLASAAGIALARAPHPGPGEAAGASDDEPGLDCGACARVRPHGDAPCPCGARQDGPAALPRIALGKFRLVRRLGKGGMGVVYEAEDLALGRTVALKTLPRSSSTLASRLRSEARVMASINHPGVATLFGAETWRGVPFLVVEYLAEETLADRLVRGPLRLDAGLELARALASTLADLHEQGLLHRDIKPGNVGFQRGGSPKLLDFGLAHLMELAADREGCLAGTPRYLPPEAWDGEPPSPAWDVWALAVVTHEALAARHPFQRATEEQTLRAVRAGEAERLDPNRAPGWLAELLEGALAREPRHRRAAGARAFAAALRG